jgi:hypothetical protein
MAVITVFEDAKILLASMSNLVGISSITIDGALVR